MECERCRRFYLVFERLFLVFLVVLSAICLDYLYHADKNIRKYRPFLAPRQAKPTEVAKGERGLVQSDNERLRLSCSVTMYKGDRTRKTKKNC